MKVMILDYFYIADSFLYEGHTHEDIDAAFRQFESNKSRNIV